MNDETLLRIIEALEGIEEELHNLNKEGLVVFSAQTLEEN